LLDTFFSLAGFSFPSFEGARGGLYFSYTLKNSGSYTYRLKFFCKGFGGFFKWFRDLITGKIQDRVLHMWLPPMLILALSPGNIF